MLRDSQLERDQLEAEKEELKAELVRAQKTHSKHKKRLIAAPASDEEDTFRRFSKAFTVMNHFYVFDPLALLSTEPDPDYSEVDPFIDATTTLEGLAAELDDLLPANLQERRLEDPERLELVVSARHVDIRAIAEIAPLSHLSSKQERRQLDIV